MSKQKQISWMLVFFLCCCNASFAQINIVADQTATALALKLAGRGVTVTNASLHCAGRANGIFSEVAGNLGLDSGVLLTNGCAATQSGFVGVNGPASAQASTNNNMPGDVMLNALAGQATIDACSLEFDVIPHGDTIKFDYVFSSEEYKNAVCGPYNDAFAFFISGPGITGYENMALVPGTNIPVTINSINNGIPGVLGALHNCTDIGAGSPFTSYYIDNSTGTKLTHMGLTKVLQAIHSVSPCNKYHLKIVIADAGDPLYDSGVFLKAGSLQTDNFDIKAVMPPFTDSTTPFCVKGCMPGHFRISRTIPSASPQTVKYMRGGTAVSGIDYSPIADSVVIPAYTEAVDLPIAGLPTPAAGNRTIELYLLAPFSCAGTSNITDSAAIVIYDSFHVSIITPDKVVCAKDTIPLDVSGPDFLVYSWLPATGIANAYTKDAVITPTQTTTYTVTASLPGSSCPSKTAQISFDVRLTPQIVLPPDTTVCFNTPIQLRAATTLPNEFYSYRWHGPGGFTAVQADTVAGIANTAIAGIYTLTVTNDTNGCKDVETEHIDVTAPAPPVVISPTVICLNRQSERLTASGEQLRWYTNQSDTLGDSVLYPNTTNVAVYQYYVTQEVAGCTSEKAAIDVEIKKCCDGNIFIPTAFSPNGDGRNDLFRPVLDYGYFVEGVRILNRWGQLVYSGLDATWNGKYGGIDAESGTYFYSFRFGCILGGNEERKGDVTLIR